MWKCIKTVCFILCPLVVAAYGVNLVTLILQWPENARLQVVTIGFAGGFVFWLMMGKDFAVWSVLEHELSHALMGLAFFRRIRFIAASDASGVTGLDEPGDNFLITLAPYFLPTLAVLWLPTIVVIRAEHQNLFLFVLGTLMGYHALSNVQEFHFQQPDILRSGPVFSVVFCVAASVVVFGFIVAAVVAGSFGGGLGFLLEGGRNVAMWIQEFWRLVIEQFPRR